MTSRRSGIDISVMRSRRRSNLSIANGRAGRRAPRPYSLRVEKCRVKSTGRLGPHGRSARTGERQNRISAARYAGFGCHSWGRVVGCRSATVAKRYGGVHSRCPSACVERIRANAIRPYVGQTASGQPTLCSRPLHVTMTSVLVKALSGMPAGERLCTRTSQPAKALTGRLGSGWCCQSVAWPRKRRRARLAPAGRPDQLSAPGFRLRRRRRTESRRATLRIEW